MSTIGYVGLDGERLSFDVPKGLNRGLVVSCIRRIHLGDNPDLVVRGLTRAELDLVISITETLESHRVPA